MIADHKPVSQPFDLGDLDGDGDVDVVVASDSQGVVTWYRNDLIEAVPGDLDNNGRVDASDIDLLYAAIDDGGTESRYDLNGDAKVDRDDVRHLVRELLGTVFGDSNLNGLFNSSDLVRVFQTGKYETNQPATWAEGDWDQWTIRYRRSGVRLSSLYTRRNGANKPAPTSLDGLKLWTSATISRRLQVSALETKAWRTT